MLVTRIDNTIPNSSSIKSRLPLHFLVVYVKPVLKTTFVNNSLSIDTITYFLHTDDPVNKDHMWKNIRVFYSHGWSLITGWTVYVIIFLLVFSAVNPSWTTEMTFSQAISLCIARGSVIAGRSDLLYSRSLGFDYYRCTWLSDGTIGYMIQRVQGIGACASTGTTPWALCILH